MVVYVEPGEEGGESGRSRAAADKAGDVDRVIDAALRLLPILGWRRLSLSAIAAEAALPIVRLYRAVPSKAGILCALYRRIDETALAEPAEPEAGERPRDRLFDLLMRRFDALAPHREALEVLRRELPADPLTAALLATRLLHSMRWTLEAAGIATPGLGGAVAVKLTAAAYLATARVWLRDESADLATTMATLDARLRRIERWLAPRSSFGRARERADDPREYRSPPASSGQTPEDLHPA